MKFKDLTKMESDNILRDRVFKFANKPKVCWISVQNGINRLQIL